MHRIVVACMDIAVPFIFILIVFAICDRFLFHSIKHSFLYLAFAFYLMAIMSLVGLPTIRLEIEPVINMIPFHDMISDMTNAILNIFLFIPMGFMLPILWKSCRRLTQTAVICFCATLIIEALQIFTFRITDVNDIITNFSGGIIGYFAAKIVTRNFSRLVCSNTKPYEMYIVFAASYICYAFGDIMQWIF